jgi:hypothetical protein
MMHLPPQAYTKETLIQAYNWLRSQPPHVQELAKSPDALVALYSKAQMHGENYLSRTNLQGFKSELKNLASMMGEFDDGSGMASKGSMGTKAAAPPPTPLNHQSATQNSLPSAVSTPPVAAPPMMPTAPQNLNGALMQSALGSLTPDPSLPLFNAIANSHQGQDLRSVLDARSWTMIQEVKNHFNLSSETEAVRLLIAMGYQKMRSQF